jgi:Flp pilus assembly pilin Flp
MDRRGRVSSVLLAMYVRTIVRLHDDDGAAATEYALLIALIALAMVVAAAALGRAVNAQLDRVARGLDPAA